jgi:uncharacterized membrane protein YhiD involved in acid resistance
VRKPTAARAAPGCRLDRHAQTRPAGGRRESLICAGRCLKVVDKFRYSKKVWTCR